MIEILSILVEKGIDNCCDEFELSWNQRDILIKDALISPVGRYKKLYAKTSSKVIYYNTEQDMEIFHQGQSWAVSLL